jgi:hypothetical protein
MFDLDGNLIKRIEKRYEKKGIPEEDIELQMRKHEIKSRDQVYAPAYKPPFRWIYCDEEGRIFVSTWDRYAQTEGYYYDIFDAEGKYLLRKPIEGDPLLFKNGKLYAISTDEAGYQYIKRFNISWDY